MALSDLVALTLLPPSWWRQIAERLRAGWAPGDLLEALSPPRRRRIDGCQTCVRARARALDRRRAHRSCADPVERRRVSAAARRRSPTRRPCCGRAAACTRSSAGGGDRRIARRIAVRAGRGGAARRRPRDARRRRGQRTGARRRLRGAPRRAERGRRHDRACSVRGARRHLSGRAPRARARAAADRCALRERARPRHAAAGAFLSAAQPDHQRTVARGRRHRGGREERLAHHRPLRARTGPRRPGGARATSSAAATAAATRSCATVQRLWRPRTIFWKSCTRAGTVRSRAALRQASAAPRTRLLACLPPGEAAISTRSPSDRGSRSSACCRGCSTSNCGVWSGAPEAADSSDLTDRARVNKDQETAATGRFDGKSTGRGRIAGEGEDHQQISRARLQGRRVDGPHPRPAEEQARRGRRQRLRGGVRVSIDSRKKVIKELKDAAKDASDIYVATDPDREGEAIGWHLTQELGGKKRKIHRLTFNEITKKADPGGAEAPARHRREDGRRAAGAPGARSAGRLQDQPAALGQGAPRAQRRPRAVGGAEAGLRSRARDRGVRPRGVLEHLRAPGGPAAAGVRSQAAQEAAARRSRSRTRNSRRPSSPISKAPTWIVSSVTTKERKRHAPPPFITSKLQQAARFPVKKTMMIGAAALRGRRSTSRTLAGGLITYMRTDSVRVADEALTAVRELHQDGVRRRVPAGEAELLQVEGGRAGRARSDPADLAASTIPKRSSSTSRPISTRSTG